jgi:hypothetical protein
MRVFYVKQRAKAIAIFAILGVGSIFAGFLFFDKPPDINQENSATKTIQNPTRQTIGQSVQARAIEAYIYGTGATPLLFVGGIHGGYEWNSVMLSYEFIDYLENNPSIIPDNISVMIIPSANPDGVFALTDKVGRFSTQDIKQDIADGTGRFNAKGVDLNRNFDCKWQKESRWRNNIVSAGEAPFSEPETRALRDFIFENNPASVIFWHSQANAVYASECENGILPETLVLMNTYSSASLYKAVESFDAYDITGDAEGWLASIRIPSITVELSSHQDIDWEQNLSGVKALFEYYKEKANQD